MVKQVRLVLLALFVATGCSGGSAAQSQPAQPAAAANANVSRGDGGAPSADEMKQILTEHQRDIKLCAEREKMRGQNFKGDTKIRVKIAPSGDVTDVQGVDVPPAGDFLATCAIDSIKSWKFPSSSGGSTVTVPLVW